MINIFYHSFVENQVKFESINLCLTFRGSNIII
nr:MAG TPA: hypothetical protein [Caudoviricetes sp.]